MTRGPLVYCAEQVDNGGEKVQRFFIPEPAGPGAGLYSTLYGFLALQGDGSTIKGLTFYEQGETPGLGGEIVNPKWRAKWQGKQIYDDTGTPKIEVIKGVVDAGRPEARWALREGVYHDERDRRGHNYAWTSRRWRARVVLAETGSVAIKNAPSRVAPLNR